MNDDSLPGLLGISPERFVIHRDYIEYAGVRCYPWPPRTEPENAGEVGWIMFRYLTAAQPGDAMWPVLGRVPAPWFGARCGAGEHAFELLLLFAANQGVVAELNLRCPNVLFAAARMSLRKTVQETIENNKVALALNRLEMLQMLGYPELRWGTLRLLEKTVRTAIGDRSINALLRVADTNPWAMRVLCQLSHVTEDTLALVKLGRPFAGPHLLHHTSLSWAEPRVTWQVQEARRLWASLRPGLPWPFRKATFQQLVNGTERLQLEAEMITFPAPPLYGSPNIVPIPTPKALLEEARLMRHCAFSLRERVSAGSMYFYKTIEPRGTAVISRTPEAWVLYDYRGVSNTTPDAGGWDRVLNWLRETQGLQGRDDILLNQADHEIYDDEQA